MLARSSERVHHALDGSADRFELANEIQFAVAAMNHDRQAKLGGEFQVTIEPLLLLREWRVVPVAVQTCLADGTHLWASCQIDDPLPVVGTGLGDMVRLDAHGGEETSMSCGDLAYRATVGRRRADGKDLHQARSPGPVEHA